MDYSKDITTVASAREIFEALTEEIDQWWTEDLSGSANREGDEFQIGFGNTRKTMMVEALVHDRSLTWLCTKAFIAMESLKNKAEWEGTKMHWTIEDMGTERKLHFLHDGLNTSFECYEVCEQGWDYFLKSLEQFLSGEPASPYKKSKNIV